MANSNESKWYYLSGTLYYIIAIVVGLVAGIFKYCPAPTPKETNATVQIPTATQDTCKAIEAALNQWVNQAELSAAMQFLSPQTTAHKQLSDDSLADEGLLSDYLQRLKIRPKLLHLQECQWDEAHEYLKAVIFKE